MNRQKISTYLIIIGILIILFGNTIRGCLNSISSNQSPSFVCQPHTQTEILQKGANIWLVGIDGSNEFNKERMGHNSKIVLKPNEKAEIEFLGGRISYHTDGGIEYFNYPWINNDYNKVRRYLGESVRYQKIKNAGNSVLIKLVGRKNQEKIFRINGKITIIKNTLNEPATIFFFYNGKEFHLNKKGEIEDCFQWAGCDGSKMYFGIYTNVN